MLEELRNFLRLSDTLISSGMPTAEQMKDVAQAGFEVVINLALPTSENALPNEGGLATLLGMEYINIPVLWEAPTHENLNEFMNAMDAHREQSIFVHCQANYRATGFITLYRVNRLGWKKKDALKDLRKIWNPKNYPVWEKFIEENSSRG